MLDLKCFIFSLFLWLSFTATPLVNAANTSIDNNLEIKKLSKSNNDHAIIVDNTLETNRDNWTFKSLKTPYKLTNNKLQQPHSSNYDYKLIYLRISKTIPLKLTSRAIIFPFHFFT